MKKTLVLAALLASMTSGCVTNDQPATYQELKVSGAELRVLSTDDYHASSIPELEVSRVAINTVFLAAQPAYERYIEEVMSSTNVNTYVAATEAAETDEAKKAVYDSLSPEAKKEVDAFVSSSVTEELISGLKDSAAPIANAVLTFQNMNPTSMLTSVDFSNLGTEKDNISFTYDQVDYLNKSIVSAYKNYQIMSALAEAE